MQGRIDGLALADILRELIREARSGLLFCRSGDQETGLYLNAGSIVNAESNVRENGLSFRLLDDGLIAPGPLQAALSRVEAGTPLADILIADGIVSEADLRRLQQALAQQIVHGLFEWNEGSYLFQEGDFSFKGQISMNTAALVIEGVRRMFAVDAIRTRLLDDDRPLRSLLANAVRLDLEPTEGFILSRIDGSLTATDICALSIISEEMTCRVLFGLYAANIIDFTGAAATSSTPTEAEPEAPSHRPQPVVTAHRPQPTPAAQPDPAPAGRPPSSPSRPRIATSSTATTLRRTTG